MGLFFGTDIATQSGGISGAQVQLDCPICSSTVKLSDLLTPRVVYDFRRAWEIARMVMFDGTIIYLILWI